MASTYEFRLLGPVEVRRDGAVLALPRRRQRALLAMLLLEANRVVSADWLLDELWGERQPATGLTALQGIVSRLRQVLEVAGEPPILLTRPPGYLLCVEDGALDVERFERLARGAREAIAREQPAEGAAMLRDALALWRGPALSDLAFEPFARTPIARLEELRVTATEERIEAELACGADAELIGELEALVAEWPERERLRRQLVLALYRAERQTEALAAHRTAVRALRDVGIDPSHELAGLATRLLQHDATLGRPARQAVEQPPRPAAQSLPIPVSEFIGRQHELHELAELLARDDVRLVTLTGPGGTGKTRLAIQIARELEETYPDGACWVPLETLTDADAVPDAIANAWAARGRSKSQIDTTRGLLVIDNFEHVLPATSEIARLLASARGVDVLVTSREPLHLGAEWHYPVEPLKLDDAVTLFEQRARRAGGEQAPAGVVPAICRRLDNLPLAIELAAARTRAFSTSSVLARLDDQFALLSGGPADAPDRQRTLRATIAWSHDLLEADERRLFSSLAVFVGGCTLDAAESICETRLETLASLVDKSLVRRRGERYAMLPTIQEYAREQLELADAAEQVQERHADWFLALADGIAARLPHSLVPPDGLIGLDAEYSNLAAALEWKLASDQPAPARRLARALIPFWSSRHARDGRRLLDAVVDMPAPPDKHWIQLAERAGWLALKQGDIAGGEERADALERVSHELADQLALVASLNLRGRVAMQRHDYTVAEALWERASELARAVGEDELASSFAGMRSDIAMNLGNFDETVAICRDALASPYAESDHEVSLVLVHNLACATLALGRPAEARTHFDRLLKIGHSSGQAVAYALFGVAAAWQEEDPSFAAALLGRAEALADEWALVLEPFEHERRGHTIAALRDALGDEAFEEARQRGRELDVDAVIAQAHARAAPVLDKLEQAGRPSPAP